MQKPYQDSLILRVDDEARINKYYQNYIIFLPVITENNQRNTIKYYKFMIISPHPLPALPLTRFYNKLYNIILFLVDLATESLQSYIICLSNIPYQASLLSFPSILRSSEGVSRKYY